MAWSSAKLYEEADGDERYAGCRNLFYLCFAQKDGAMIPIQNGLTTDPNAYINPLPHGLMLTAIVVSLGTTGVAIALLMRIKEIYGSVEEVEVLRRASK